MTPANQ